ncbi:MAG: DMT family transporter [Clostridia bacterium]|nr:DMT family transporter [Clostridia bacterium]
MIKNDKTKGIIYIIISAFFFALMGLFVKLSGDLPIIQKSFFRNAVAMIFAFVLITKNKEWALPKGKNIGFLLIRAIAGTGGILCNFYALSNMNLADASMLNKLSPFFAVIFSLFLLKEKANLKQILAVVTAFIGALFVMKPSFSFEAFPAFMGFIGGLGAGLAYACVRKLTQNGFKGNLIIFYFSTFSCVVTLPWLIFDFTPMSPQQWLYLILAGLSASGGQYFITTAYSKAPAKEISIYDYSQIIFTTLLSLIVFGDLPDALSLVGYAIIISAALFNAWNSLRKTKP